MHHNISLVATNLVIYQQNKLKQLTKEVNWSYEFIEDSDLPF
jgi:hypothetical protein